MKTPDVRPEGPARQVASTTETRDPKKKGAFAKVLDRKLAEEKPAEPAPQQPLPPLVARGEAVAPAAPVHAPREIDAVASEIAVAVRGPGTVEISFDSRTMAGLQVRISKDNGRLAVSLQSQSPDICRLMAQHSDALAQRLEARGYPNAVVQVRTPSAPAFRERAAHDGRREGGGQQQKDGRRR